MVLQRMTRTFPVLAVKSVDFFSPALSPLTSFLPDLPSRSARRSSFLLFRLLSRTSPRRLRRSSNISSRLAAVIPSSSVPFPSLPAALPSAAASPAGGCSGASRLLFRKESILSCSFLRRSVTEEAGAIGTIGFPPGLTPSSWSSASCALAARSA